MEKNLLKAIIFSIISFGCNILTAQNIALDWAKRIGGTSSETGYSMRLDASGNIYITGYFMGTADFDPSASTYNLTSVGDRDIFIQKLDASGNFVWAKAIGGTSLDEGKSITIDDLGNIYTTGFFQGTVDFDPSASTYNLTSAGSRDVFIQKLDTSGNFVWAKAIGGSSSDIAMSISKDALGNIYTTGSFQGTADFDPSANTYNLTVVGVAGDVFIQKLDASGNFVWAKQMGGTSLDEGKSITIDDLGNIYTTGYFTGTADFDPTSGIYNLTSAGAYDIFIQKLDAFGNLVWVKAMGGSVGNDYAQSIITDTDGNIYTTGYFEGTADFDPGLGSFTFTSAGTNDIFISKLDSSGNFVWAKQMGGTSLDEGQSISIDAYGNIYTTGGFSGTADFDPSASTYNLTSVGGYDIFIQKLDASGNLVWAKAMGGIITDIGYSTSTDASGNVYVVGNFFGTADFDPDVSTYNLTSAGFSADIFVAKYSQLTTGITDLSVTDISIYPNPTSGIVNFNFSNLNVQKIIILDITGKVIDEKIVNNQIENIDFSNYSNGLYLIKLQTEKEVLTTKIIVKE